MAERITPTELRSRLYAVLDQVAETGEPVEIVRRGRILRIVAESAPPRTFSVSRLVPHAGAILGDPDDLVSGDWSGEWHAFLGDSE